MGITVPIIIMGIILTTVHGVTIIIIRAITGMVIIIRITIMVSIIVVTIQEGQAIQGIQGMLTADCQTGQHMVIAIELQEKLRAESLILP